VIWLVITLNSYTRGHEFEIGLTHIFLTI